MHQLHAQLRRYLLGIWRWRWLVAGIAWAVCLLGWGVVTTIPNIYQASSRIYVDTDAVLTPLLRGVALDNSPNNQVDMLQRTLLSRPNLEKLISKTDLELQVSGPTDLERLVGQLATAVKIQPQTKNLFTITYRNTKPKLAYQVVQTVLSLFIESKAGSNRSDMANARQFIDQQIANYEQKLRQMESQRAAFDSKYVGLLPGENGGASRLDVARAALVSLQDALKQAQLREQLAHQQLASTPATISTSSLLPGAGAADAAPQPKACQDLDAARVRFTDQNPTVIMLQAECTEARKHPVPGTSRGLAGSTGGSVIPNPVAEKLRLQIFDLQAAIVSITQKIADKNRELTRLEAMLRGAPGLLAQYTDMLRDYDVVRRNYPELIERREAMRIAAAADTEAEKVKLEVVDPPQVPNIPVAPNRVLLMSLMLPLALGSGVGAALLLQTFDTSFHTIEELRGLGRPVMGAVSLVADRVPLARRLFQAIGFAAAMLLLCAMYGGLLLRIMHKGATGI